MVLESPQGIRYVTVDPIKRDYDSAGGAGRSCEGDTFLKKKRFLEKLQLSIKKID